jgi:hypothetical protein
MIMMNLRRSVLLRATVVSSLALLGSGCWIPTGMDGAVVTSVFGIKAGGGVIGGQRDCSSIYLGNSQMSESRPSWGFFAMYERSADGEIFQQLFIQPEGVDPDFDVTTETGEVAMEWTFTPSTFGDDDFIVEEIETHRGELIEVAHWGAETHCDETDPPEDYESMTP